MSDDQIRELEPKLQNKVFDRYITGYIAFVITILITALNLDVKLRHLNLVVSLLFLSLPPLILLIMLDYRIRIMQNRENSAIRGFAYFVGLGLSLLGFTIFLSNYSFLASILFPISIIGWFLLADFITYHGYKKDSQA